VFAKSERECSGGNKTFLSGSEIEQFRIVKAGSETTIVTLDDDKRFYVTSSMLGSDELRKYGSYDLSLGSLDQGTHSIHLAVGENNYGNGRYWWDALILISPTD
jgi:hypothetical protein